MSLPNERGRSEEGLDMTLEGRFSVVSPEISMATSIIANNDEGT